MSKTVAPSVPDDSSSDDQELSPSETVENERRNRVLKDYILYGDIPESTQATQAALAQYSAYAHPVLSRHSDTHLNQRSKDHKYITKRLSTDELQSNPPIPPKTRVLSTTELSPPIHAIHEYKPTSGNQTQGSRQSDQPIATKPAGALTSSLCVIL